MYRCNYFKIAELVDPIILKEHGERCWELLDEKALQIIDLLRESYGPAVINGTYNGKVYTESGLRRFDTKTGAKHSMHKYGKAFDLKFTNYTAEHIRLTIKDVPKLWYNYGIRRIENDVSWLHIDTANTNFSTIQWIDP